MTIAVLPDTERRTEYTLVSATTGPLNVSFNILADGTDYGQWIEVWDDDVKLTAGTDWTLESPSGSLGVLARPITDARITFTEARTGNIQIVGAARPRRTTQFTSGAAIPADDHNRAYTDLQAKAREMWDRFKRTIQGPPGETLAVLPPAESRAGKAAAWDQNGDLTAVAESSLSALGLNLWRPENHGADEAWADGVDDAPAIEAMFTAIEAQTKPAWIVFSRDYNFGSATTFNPSVPFRVTQTGRFLPLVTGLYPMVRVGPPPVGASLLSERSTSSVLTGTGAKTFTVASGLAIAAGDPIKINYAGSTTSATSHSATTGIKVFTVDTPLGIAGILPGDSLSIFGGGIVFAATVLTFGGSTLTVDVTSASGSGSNASWTINQSVGSVWYEMLGTVTSYTGTTLVCNITSATGSSTLANWLITSGFFRENGVEDSNTIVVTEAARQALSVGKVCWIARNNGQYPADGTVQGVGYYSLYLSEFVFRVEKMEGNVVHMSHALPWDVPTETVPEAQPFAVYIATPCKDWSWDGLTGDGEDIYGDGQSLNSLVNVSLCDNFTIRNRRSRYFSHGGVVVQGCINGTFDGATSDHDGWYPGNGDASISGFGGTNLSYKNHDIIDPQYFGSIWVGHHYCHWDDVKVSFPRREFDFLKRFVVRGLKWWDCKSPKVTNVTVEGATVGFFVSVETKDGTFTNCSACNGDVSALHGVVNDVSISSFAIGTGSKGPYVLQQIEEGFSEGDDVIVVDSFDYENSITGAITSRLNTTSTTSNTAELGAKTWTITAGLNLAEGDRIRASFFLDETATDARVLINTTSATSNAFQPGLLTFTVETGLSISALDILTVRAATAPSKYFIGTVQTYNSGSGELVVVASALRGGVGGTYTSWLVTSAGSTKTFTISTGLPAVQKGERVIVTSVADPTTKFIGTINAGAYNTGTGVLSVAVSSVEGTSGSYNDWTIVSDAYDNLYVRGTVSSYSGTSLAVVITEVVAASAYTVANWLVTGDKLTVNATAQNGSGTPRHVSIGRTSASSVAIGTGSKTFTWSSSGPAMSYMARGGIVSAYRPENLNDYMFGVVADVTSTSVVIDVLRSNDETGSGTYDLWAFMLMANPVGYDSDGLGNVHNRVIGGTFLNNTGGEDIGLDISISAGAASTTRDIGTIFIGTEYGTSNKATEESTVFLDELDFDTSAQMQYVSATQLRLGVVENNKPLYLPVLRDYGDGVNAPLVRVPHQTLVTSGLANTSVIVNGASGNLAANTSYTIFAYLANPTDTSLTFEFSSTTGIALAIGTGLLVKSADHRKRAVGWVRTNASSQFIQDSVYSYVNKYDAPNVRIFRISELNPFPTAKLMLNGSNSIPEFYSSSDAGATWNLVWKGGALASGGLIVPSLSVESTDAGAAEGPSVQLYRNSASPLAADIIGSVKFDGEDSAGNTETYAKIVTVIDDATSTQEDAHVNIQTVVAGTLATRVALGQGVYHPSATGTDKGANTANFGALHQNGALGSRVFISVDVDLNAANSDHEIKIDLPSWATRYRLASSSLFGTTGAANSATFGVFTATGGGGTAIVASGTACTITNNTDGTALNLQNISVVLLTATYTLVGFPKLYFRTQTAHGSAVTGKYMVELLCFP